MSFLCHLGSFFLFQLSIPPVPQRKRSLVSQSFFLRGRVGTFSSKVACLRPLSGPEVTSKESPVWHQIVVAISFIQHHHWVRQFWVQIVCNKSIYSLARRRSPCHQYTWASRDGKRDKEKAVSVCFYSGLQGLSLSLPVGGIPVRSPINGYTEQGRQMPPWPPGYKL